MTEFEKELVRFVSGYLDAGVSAEDYVKAFSQRLINSIGQQSKPKVSKELEEYASQAGFDYVDDIVLQAEPNHRWNDHDVENAHRDGIIKGASWQKEQIIKRATTAIKERWYDKFDTTLLGGLIQLGMDKQKEQMMKEAVEGEVISISDNGWESIRIPKKIHKCGDKVKFIIIVKEEGK